MSLRHIPIQRHFFMDMRSGEESLVDRLRGMYGFVIWDREKKK